MDNNPHHVCWSADRFYWAILDTSILTPSHRFKRSSKSLDYLFESYLPLPIEDIHATYISIDKNHTLACGIERSVLVDKITSDVHRLSPLSLPSFLQDKQIDPDHINLLTGSCEPEVLQKTRNRWLMEIAIIVLFCTILIIAGLERRNALYANDQRMFIQSRNAIYTELFGTDFTNSNQPPALQMVAELRRLRLTHKPATSDTMSMESNATETLEQFLHSWPHNESIQTESIIITPLSITMICILPSAQDAQQFAQELKAPKGWRAFQPEISSLHNGVRLTIRLENIAESDKGT